MMDMAAPEEAEALPEEGAEDDFALFAGSALGTDDPDRIAAFKEAIMACMGTNYGEDEGEDMGLGLLLGTPAKEK